MSWLKILTSKYQDHSDTELIDSEVDGINNVRESESNMDESCNYNSVKTERPLPIKSSPTVPLLNLTDLSEKLTTIIDELEAVQETTPMTPENNISTQTPEPTQPYWLNTLKYYLCYCLAR